MRACPNFSESSKRLRARFLATGLEGFDDTEVVELLLSVEHSGVGLPDVARQLVERFGNLRGIIDASTQEMEQVAAGNADLPMLVRIIRETAQRYLLQTAATRCLLVDSQLLENFWRMRIGSLSNEVVQVAYLDSGYRLIRDGVETLAEGTVDRATIHPRRVLEGALRRHASILVIAHNHPNGQVQPTEHDKLITRALVLAAEAIAIRIHDHLIVSGDRVFSFRAAGLL